jgi:hypothetical protein
MPGVWPVEDREPEYRVDDDDIVDSVLGFYEAMVGESRSITAELASPDAACRHPDTAQWSLRWILLHMRGDRPSRRPRRHHPRVDRRRHRGLTRNAPARESASPNTLSPVEEQGKYDVADFAGELARAHENHEVGTTRRFENDHVRVWESTSSPGSGECSTSTT